MFSIEQDVYIVTTLFPIITCEHAGNDVPTRFARFFSSASEQLQSHLGWDPGAREIAAFFARELHAPFFKCESTRLLVEPNRSLHSETLFSKFVQELSESERQEVLNQYYIPHRASVEDRIRVSAKPVLHLSVHTFTPVFNGIVRDVDVGLLFDPERPNENRFCHLWMQSLNKHAPDVRCRFNEPYLGTDDGFTTYLRTKFNDEEYLGIEIEVSQRFVETSEMERIAGLLLVSLKELLSD